MAEAARLSLYSIAAHRGFAEALVAGLVPRYAEPGIGVARLTLLLPSARAARTVTQAFVRHAGESGAMAGQGGGLLLPRMVLVGDLDLDEKLGPLFDSLGAGAAVPPAADPVRRWLRLAQLIRSEAGPDALSDSAALRLAFEAGRTIDRLLAEEVSPEDLLGERVLALVDSIADHWQTYLRAFARLYTIWKAELDERGELDAAERRNRLFHIAARRLREDPPATPIVAAGVTSAAPAVAALLKAVAQSPRGAVILPDFDLTMDEEVWDELGIAGRAGEEVPFGRDDAVTHPQYHLKLLLNRMGVAREEVQPWHRSGLAASPPARSRALASLFMPPRASRVWFGLPADRRRLDGVRLIEAANPEEEAQAIALLVREALETPGRRVAVVTPDRALARRVVHHLGRWDIAADDSAGQPLPQTPAGRVLLGLADLAATGAAPVPLIALLSHPLVAAGEGRAAWLASVRRLDLKLRGPRPAAGLAALSELAEAAGLGAWWAGVAACLEPVAAAAGERLCLADWLDRLADAGAALCGEGLWAREDGRALSAFVEEVRRHARDVPVEIAAAALPAALRDAMDRVAVRPPFGGHPRVAIYGLLEARLTRADLMICAGLNEGVWPSAPAPDALLAPAVLRALGVPGGDFRIGLAAHDLAGALGAPQVVLTRARRAAQGPAVASRFWLRVTALQDKEFARAKDADETLKLARELDPAPAATPAYPRPAPAPPAAARPRTISVTALDLLRQDPFQFYARNVLRLRPLDALDADPGPAWQGSLAHAILEDWHEGKGSLVELSRHHLARMAAHPLQAALWQPRLIEGLKWVERTLAAEARRRPVLWEKRGETVIDGVTLIGKADRIDRLEDGTLAIVDYKTGKAPDPKEGYELQLGTLGVIAAAGGFPDVTGEPAKFEYWSLAKHEDAFGKIVADEDGPKGTVLERARQRAGEAIARFLIGDDPFTARPHPAAPVRDDYDQLMRLAEWYAREERPA